MNKDDAAQIIDTLVVYFGELPGQPDWTGPSVTMAWFDMLSPFSLGDGLAALNRYRAHVRDLLDADKRVYFPIIDEFGNYMRKVATEREQEDTQRSALDAHIKCDGSRWIVNAPGEDDELPWPDHAPGMVPCPACNPTNYAQWRAGREQYRPDVKGQPKSPAPCRSLPEGVLQSGRGHRWAEAALALRELPPSFAAEWEALQQDDEANLERLEAFLKAVGARPVAARASLASIRVGRRISELDDEPVGPQPGDSAKRCPWCGDPIHRAKVVDWWVCPNGHAATTRQVGG